MLLSKGFEVEMYTGTPEGQIVGLADQIVAALGGFVREPDSRNVEYTTPPLHSYEGLLCALLRPRQQLRQYLRTLGDYTILPGSTLALGDTSRFYRSDPGNPYHTYIEQTYGTAVVTASIHINVGISDPDTLLRACRLVRLEAPLYLALSASSPFLGGAVTGYQSTRWQMFPQTPAHVPLFASHQHFIRWTEAQIAAGTMQNVRHLWTSVRPNGDCRPYNLNRLELRICDLVTDPIALLGITALLEGRLWQVLSDPDLDPLHPSFGRPEADLLVITRANEMAVARDGLDALVRRWQDDQVLTARDWIDQLYQEVWPLAHQRGFSCFLSPVRRILRTGNCAGGWLDQIAQGRTPAEVMALAIREMAQGEAELVGEVCLPQVA